MGGRDNDLDDFTSRLADALGLGCMQRIPLFLVMRLLSAHALSALQFHRQIARRLRILGHEARCIGPALHLAHDAAQDCSLALDGVLKAAKLFDKSVPTGLAAQLFPLLGKCLLRTDPAALTRLMRAISSKRLSTRCAMAFSCTVVSTVTPN